jgi:hypothetical protein
MVPANGMTIDIGVAENGTEAIGSSAVKGTGTNIVILLGRQ